MENCQLIATHFMNFPIYNSGINYDQIKIHSCDINNLCAYSDETYQCCVQCLTFFY